MPQPRRKISTKTPPKSLKGGLTPIVVSPSGGIPTFVWIIAGGIAIYTVYRLNSGASSLLEKVGLKDDENDKAVKNYISSDDDYKKAFNPKYHFEVPNGTPLYTRSKTDAMATQLWDAFYFWNYVRRVDDLEEQVYDVFNQCPNKAQMSWLTDVFSQNHQEDLFLFLQSKMSSSEMMNILNIIKTKPDY